jgi:glycopeptide antibiotics resistance protein
MFVAYLVLLTWLVLWKLEVPFFGDGSERQVKLVPFVATARAGASAPVEVLANILLFVPFGGYLRLLAPSTRWWRLAAVVAATSVLFEVGQYLLAVGRSDLSDVVANTAGAVLGLGLVGLVRLRLRDGTRPVMTRVCAGLTVVAVVAVGLFVASPFHYGLQPSGDVIVCRAPDGNGLSCPQPPRRRAAP